MLELELELELESELELKPEPEPSRSRNNMISSALARLAGALLLLLGGAADGQGTKKIVEVLDSDGGRQLAQVGAAWSGQTPQDLHREYSAIFHHGNRNAASHRWTTFLLERSAQMTEQRLELMFSGFCAVSGSPVQPQDRTRYRLTLDHRRLRRGENEYYSNFR